jgi:hypothetical protein
VAAGKKAVVGVEGSVQQVQPVELLEDHGFQQERGGLRIAGVRGLDALETLDGPWIVQVVEVLEGLAHQRLAVHRIGVHLGPT